ncbi:hypothetical protein LOTGIDRAFT_161621 [Lottia gigantea]|uniref:Death domain-containing protein n=1 Tax=Lottia gigantea TaxID=225164 RepID=V4BWV4_LOTGI|nr:hypothetical protein LOTGIDRAFT_161621 [Lottia gigantea]ESO93519.1 hypothetical protein LOTGIDRAFT_161621 [Lottia gigantea]
MPPYSRDAEHKYILKITQKISSNIKDFKQDFIQGVRIDYPSCVKCLDRVLEDWEKDKGELKTWRDYLDLVTYKQVDRKVKTSAEFKDLYFICDRTSHFEGLISDRLNPELMRCMYDHLYRYCVSFELETKGLEIESVQIYETDLTLYRKNIDSKFDAIADAINQIENLGSPFHDLVTNGRDQETQIEDVCDMLLDICQTAKSWIKQDKGYSEEIWQEMQTYQSNRLNLKDEESKLFKKTAGIIKKIEHTEKLKKQAIKKYETNKRERKKLQSRIEVVEDKLVRLHINIERKREAFYKTQEHRALENPLTPRMQITYDERLDSLQRDVYSMDGQIDPTEKHLQKLKLDLKNTRDTTYEHKVDAATRDNEIHDLRKELPPIDIELQAIKDEIKSNEAKLAVMQKIRSHIAIADTLRKLHNDEEIEDKKQPETDNLNEALQTVSEMVGIEWKKIYPKLPFIPPRDSWKKTRDIEILDITAMRCDQTHQEQALKAFEKWLTFNRHGNLQQLIRTLRKVRKVELASELEEKYMVEDVY